MQDRAALAETIEINMSDIKQNLEALADRVKELSFANVDRLGQICAAMHIRRVELSDAINTLLTPGLGKLRNVTYTSHIGGFFSIYNPSLSEALHVVSAFGSVMQHQEIEELATTLIGLLGLKPPMTKVNEKPGF
ncbi:MAG: hypothetical protein WAW86_04960 [Gammaproteobacteria bacterium]